MGTIPGQLHLAKASPSMVKRARASLKNSADGLSIFIATSRHKVLSRACKTTPNAPTPSTRWKAYRDGLDEASQPFPPISTGNFVFQAAARIPRHRVYLLTIELALSSRKVIEVRMIQPKLNFGDR